MLVRCEASALSMTISPDPVQVSFNQGKVSSYNIIITMQYLKFKVIQYKKQNVGFQANLNDRDSHHSVEILKESQDALCPTKTVSSLTKFISMDREIGCTSRYTVYEASHRALSEN